MNVRQNKIIELLNLKGEILLQELKDVFPEVSMITLRRDLINFEKEGLLIRTHKGGLSTKKYKMGNNEENPYNNRAVENKIAKHVIAKKALDYIERGRSIYFDNGSTIMSLAEIMPDDNFSIITSGVNITVELLKRDKISTMILGGLVNKNTISVSGHFAMNIIDNINIDIAFMSASGFSIEKGFTNSDVYEYEIKKKIVKIAKNIIILMDSSKINKNLPFTFAGLGNINVWICETKLDSQIEKELKNNNVKLI